MEKKYFENEDATTAHSEDYFQQLMKDDGLTEIEVFEAVPIQESEEEYVFCTDTDECYEKANCGTVCSAYEAISETNKKCVHHGQYCDFGETVVLKRNEP